MRHMDHGDLDFPTKLTVWQYFYVDVGMVYEYDAQPRFPERRE